jgi:hypothetical protein
MPGRGLGALEVRTGTFSDIMAVVDLVDEGSDELEVD